MRIPDESQLSLEYTGADCVYSEPTQFQVGDEFEITATDVTEERMDVGFAVLQVRHGISVAQVRDKRCSPRE